MSEVQERPLKILITSLISVGHFNACLGIGSLLRKRGHQVYFAHYLRNRSTVESKGFQFISLSEHGHPDHPIDEALTRGPDFFKAKFLVGLKKSPLKMIQDELAAGTANFGFLHLITTCNGENYAMMKIIDQLKPDICLADYLWTLPWMVKVDAPVVPIMSTSPNDLYPAGPPLGSGFSVHDPKELWDQFRSIKDRLEAPHLIKARQMFQSFLVDYQPRDYAKQLGIYIYPGPLDYVELGPPKANWIRLDSSVDESNLTSSSFVIPEKIASLPGKLIYLSMGTLASRVTELMDMIIPPLAKSPHRFIISTGPKGETIKLFDNMWGDKFVNQIAILPQVDLFITHGGSNSLIEGLSAGKPLLVIPLFVDQYDNAQRVVDLNLGSRLNLWEFSEDKLIGTIDHVLNNQLIATNVQRVAQEMKKSDSSDSVCSAIEQLAITKISPIKH